MELYFERRGEGISISMDNPAGIHEEQTTHVASSLIGMKHNPGISLNWTLEEQLVLEDELTKHASGSSLTRYGKIALKLQNKTVRDVALRVRWTNQKKENNETRKDDQNLTRKRKDRKAKVSDAATTSSHFAAQPSVFPYAPAMFMMDNDDGISFKALGGPAGELLEQNAQALSQISANLATSQLQDNIKLFCQTRDNIIKLLNDTNDMSEVMRQMPPLPVKLNDIHDSQLHTSNHQM